MPHPIIPAGQIVKGNWIDVPYRDGFKEFPGIYLLCAGSNSAFGNYDGGFPSVADAEQFKLDNDLGSEWRVYEHGLDAEASFDPSP
jgi:hypothetical protein